MNVFEAIEKRRSIRKFKEDPVPDEVLAKILTAGTLAPSGKNKQPWRFYIVRGEQRQEMTAAMQKGMDRLQKMGISSSSAKYSIRVLAQAPVTVFVFNPYSKHPLSERHTMEKYSDVVDIQSVGAAIQDMLLAALELGLGSLWICDVFFGYEELCDWLRAEGQMIAAVSFGYPNISPAARPRKSLDEVTVFVGETSDD